MQSAACAALSIYLIFVCIWENSYKPQSLCEARSKSNPNVVFRQKVSRPFGLHVSQFIDAPIAFNFAKPLKAQSSKFVLIFIFGFDSHRYVCSAHQEPLYTFLNWHRHVLNVYDSRMSNDSLTSMQLFRFEEKKETNIHSFDQKVFVFRIVGRIKLRNKRYRTNAAYLQPATHYYYRLLHIYIYLIFARARRPENARAVFSIARCIGCNNSSNATK